MNLYESFDVPGLDMYCYQIFLSVHTWLCSLYWRLFWFLFIAIFWHFFRWRKGQHDWTTIPRLFVDLYKYSALVVHIFSAFKKLSKKMQVYNTSTQQHKIKLTCTMELKLTVYLLLPAWNLYVCWGKQHHYLERLCIVFKLRNINYLQSFFVKRFIKF